MATRLKTLLFVLLMTFSVYAGAPVAGDIEDKVCPMKCCKKAEALKKHSRDQKYLCRIIMCSDSVPTTQVSFSANSMVPVYVKQSPDPGFDSILPVLTRNHPDLSAPVRGGPASTQPIYIQIHSLLI